MNSSELQDITDQFCFPDTNNSCRREMHKNVVSVVFFIILSFISVCTVLLNLLVIISISHFKQLHTPTNLLIMSLAVADLLVGLIVMPIKVMDLIDSCWYFGKTFCFIFPTISYISVSASAGSLVFIAVDRYIAINNPLLYSTQITVSKTSLFIILTWSCSILYNFLFFIFQFYIFHPERFSTCVGECAVVQDYLVSIIDLFITFFWPCFTMLSLYLKICKVARHQARSINAMDCDNAHGRGVKGSKYKAFKTLGIVIFVYLFCWLPYFCNALSVDNLTSLSLLYTVFSWLIYMNSSINPLIYAIFYPWFRASVKHIITCRIFQASSSTFNLFSENIESRKKAEPNSYSSKD